MTGSSSDRHLVISSRMSPGYHLNDAAKKHLQHVFTVWFPRGLYRDLTDDTIRVDVVVRRSTVSDRNVYTTAFVRGNGSVIKTIDYDEDRLTGAKCPSYDQERSGYCGTKDGADFRLVVYRADSR